MWYLLIEVSLVQPAFHERES